MTFNLAEQEIISNAKYNIRKLIFEKAIFWNGITFDCVIAGGFFASAMQDGTYKDIDVFILNDNKGVFSDLTAGSRSDNTGAHDWEVRGDAGEYLQNPHILATALNKKTKAQYILTDYTSREELLKSFDYKHCTVSYVPKEEKLYITRSAFDAIRNKQLIVNGDKEPKEWRETKFKNRGWQLSMKDMKIDHQQALKESFQHLNDKYDTLIKDALGDMLDDVMKRQTIEIDPYLQTK